MIQIVICPIRETVAIYATDVQAPFLLLEAACTTAVVYGIFYLCDILCVRKPEVSQQLSRR